MKALEYKPVEYCGGLTIEFNVNDMARVKAKQRSPIECELIARVEARTAYAHALNESDMIRLERIHQANNQAALPGVKSAVTEDVAMR